MKNISPKHIDVSDHFGSSAFMNSETETILRNVVKQQRKADPENWTQFTWEQYKAFCTHKVSSSEKQVLDAMVNGGKPVWNTSAYLSSGWLEFDGVNYKVAEKTIEMLFSKYPLKEVETANQ